MPEALRARPAARVARQVRVVDGPVGAQIAPRPRLYARLEEATAMSRLVVLTGAAGAGKSALLSSWAASLGPGTRLSLVTPAHPSTLPSLVDEAWGQVPSALREHAAGVLRSPGASPDRFAWPVVSSDRSLVVLDDPRWPIDAMNDALDRLLRRTGPEMGVVLAVTDWPALDLGRLGVAGESVPITTDDLAMNLDEIAEVLSRHQVEATDAIVRAVSNQTDGWACGVRLAAQFLHHGDSVAEALRETDRAIEDYLQTAVICRLPAVALDLLTATSVVADVDPDLADAVVGPGARRRIAGIKASRGFVQVRPDGSFRTHPLLRRLLLRRLRQSPSRALSASRRAAQWTADHGQPAAAIEIAIQAGDWERAARDLVDSLAVPRLLVSTDHGLLSDADTADALGAAEPLLLAAAALQRGLPDLAARALLDNGRDGRAEARTVAHRVSAALLRLASASWHGDQIEGLEQGRRLAGLLPQLSLAQRAAAPELVPLIQSRLGSCELWNRAPDRARAAFERGSRALQVQAEPDVERAVRMAAAECLGQLAWLEALGGELTRAVEHADPVLTAGAADRPAVGIVHAQLAIVCVHAARGELEQATQRFDSVVGHSASIDSELEPALAAAIQLTAGRLATVVSDARALPRPIPSAAVIGWFGDQLSLARVEAELNAFQPSQALRLLRESGLSTGAESSVLRARALIQLGDLAAVGATLRACPIEPTGVVTQIQLELVESWLAHAHGDRRRERALIDRALRTACREELRTPVAWAKSWLQTAVTADRELLRRHGPFLASIRSTRPYLRGDDLPSGPVVAAPVATLTQRELDILQRLGSLSTNEEIAAELFLSTNTVKTHLKSLFRKLYVSRRSEAFRRGRALGLC